MLIKKDGIFRNIDQKDFGVFQAMGYEKVVVCSKKVEEPVLTQEVESEKTKVEEPVKELIEEPIVTPKSKKKKNL